MGDVGVTPPPKMPRATPSAPDVGRMSSVLLASPVPALWMDRRTRTVLDVNDALCALAGAPRTALVDLRVEGVIEPLRCGDGVEGWPRGRWCTAELNGSEAPRRVEVWCDDEVAPGGTVVWVREAWPPLGERGEDERHQAQKMEALGQLAAGIAHDFANVLTTIVGNADLAAAAVPEDGDVRRGIEEIRRAGERATALTRQLLAFSRKQALQRIPRDVNAVVVQAHDMLTHLVGEGFELELALGCGVDTVVVDAAQLEVAIINLCVNARDAMPDGGRITIGTENVELCEAEARHRPGLSPGRHVIVRVSDTGHGIDPETARHIFQPFFTTKAERGTGIGLAAVYGIVKQHDGYVEVSSDVGAGSTFRIYFPAAPERSGGPRPSAAPETVGGDETVLVVEDEPAMRALLRRVLERYGYHVLEAATARDALACVDALDGRVHGLLTDIVLPDMDGRGLAEALASRGSKTGVLFMSGYPGDVLARRGGRTPDAPEPPYLVKPFAPQELLRRLRAVLDENGDGMG